jgi:transposase
VVGAKRFHAWAFRRLYQHVEYEAEMDGIEVEQVSPAYTSQRCSSCGFTHESNRRSKPQFVCQKCECELNADDIASKNVARKLLGRLQNRPVLDGLSERCSDERLHSGQTASGGSAPCQCALTSGTLTLNGEYHASVDSTAEGESTDKSATSVVGN